VEDVDNNVIINAFRNNLKISAKDTAPSAPVKSNIQPKGLPGIKNNNQKSCG
jgi:hypothetical protein